MTPETFIATLKDAARQSYAQSGVFASVTLAQAALESGWGGTQLTQKALNLFGIKADSSWKGAFITLPTTEYVNGKPITVMAKWRKYDSWFDSLVDHAKFLHENPRYAPVFQCKTPETFAHALQSCGYSTNPNYAETLIAVMKGRNMQQYDAGVIVLPKTVSTSAPQPEAPPADPEPEPVPKAEPVVEVSTQSIAQPVATVKAKWSLWTFIKSLF